MPTPTIWGRRSAHLAFSAAMPAMPLLPCLSPSRNSMYALHNANTKSVTALASLGAMSSSRIWSPSPHTKNYACQHPQQSQRHSSSSGNYGRKRLHACCSSSVKGEKASASKSSTNGKEKEMAKVSAVLFDMDGVLCNSEEASRRAAVEVFERMGVGVSEDDFVPFMGTGEANFLGGVARAKNVKNFDPLIAKKQFFEIYIEKYAKPNSGLGYSGSLELVMQCKTAGLKVAVASSADRIKVNANLAAAGLPLSCFDAIISADSFQNLKPAPDIFLAASKSLNVSPDECVVIEDAFAGIEAAKAAKMRCIAVATTLSEEKLVEAGPSLVRKDIGNISLSDILNCTSTDKEKVKDDQMEIQLRDSEGTVQGPDTVDHYSPLQSSVNFKVSFPGGLQVSRYNILRIGALGAAISCLLIATSRLKILSYTSPKAILNALLGVGQSAGLKNDGQYAVQSERISQIKNYIKDIETREIGQKVPEFPSKLDWLNTAPLRFQQDLQGKVVLLDFWTYCCINCMHVLPDLKYLEQKFRERPFAVIGVHSAKFDNEKDLDAIRYAVLRYEITHPVVNDGDMILWRELGINSWPTFVLVSPTGKILAQLLGEGHLHELEDLVEASLQFYSEKNLLDNRPIPEMLEKEKDSQLLVSPLKFPGKVAADISNQRLFISDSNNHRIVVTDLGGNFIMQVGCTGEEALRDGTFNVAAFNRPQGLAYDPIKNLLYVADTENHALREIDFVSETVRTLAGNGEKGSDYKGGRQGKEQVLNSPWDVCLDVSLQTIFIAMAGQHQIWQHSILDGTTKVFSGDGYERNLNGRSSTTTSFAQPSGISLSPDTQDLYVADSESSSIREVNLKTGGSKLLAGGDPLLADNLFQFGDHDGSGSEAQLQHPLGVCTGNNGLVYIADSYNHKIKVLDPRSRKVTTLVGTGIAGFKDGHAQSAQLSEPAGLCQVGNGKLMVADTNNNVIRVITNKDDQSVSVSTLQIKGVPPKSAGSSSRRGFRKSKDVLLIEAPPVTVPSGHLRIHISLPSECHFSKEANSKFYVDVKPASNANADDLVIQPSDGVLDSQGSAFLDFQAHAATTANIYTKVYYCKQDEVCLYKSLAFQVPFKPQSQLLMQAQSESSGSSMIPVIPLSYSMQAPASK